MKTITVDASKKYDILIGSGLLPELGNRIAAVCKCQKAAIISDRKLIVTDRGRGYRLTDHP